MVTPRSQDFPSRETRLARLKGVFQRLKDPILFRQAYVAFDTVCWPGNLDIAPETLYDRSRAVAAHAPK
ncbi:MAG: DUF2442 domain-containing protein [Betaproteobacteria bacterium]|nr:DUF2442 domain-containing protein [Betaproteobacteria bacterium]